MVGELTQAFATHGNFPAALGKVNSRAAPVYAFVLTGVAASITLWFNYNASMAKVFTFLSVLVTAANLPLYLACSLAVWVLWRQGKLKRVGRRELIWFAVGGAGRCVLYLGIRRYAREDLLWALALAALGIPFHFWARGPARRALAAHTARSSYGPRSPLVWGVAAPAPFSA